MKSPTTTLISIALFVIGILLALVTVDREFIALAPTQGQAHTIPLTTSNTYVQDFYTQAQTVSAVSLYLRPLQRNLPAEAITVTVSAADQSQAFQVPAVFIGADTPTQVALKKPLTITPNTPARITITIPDTLSGKVGVQERVIDDTFNTDLTSFMISGQPQANPLAYDAYQSTRPLFTLQLAGLSGIAALYIFSSLLPISPRIRYTGAILLLTLLYSLPLAVAGTFSIPLFVIQVFLALRMLSFFRAYTLSPVAQAVGISLFVGTTWWAAHIISPDATFSPLTLKDALVDPNQTIISHAAGGYIGLPGLLLALLGIVTTGRRFKVAVGIAIIGGIASQFITPHAILILVAALSWFAAFGMESLRSFLEPRHRLTNVLLYALALIIIIDIYTVGTTTLQSTLLYT